MTIKKEKAHIPLDHYFWIFLIASILGTYYEEILHIVNHFFKYGEFDYSRRSGLFWGPISPVYGIGAAMFLFLLGRKNKSKISIFLEASILGGVAEYVMSLVQEFTTGTTSWDYSDKFLNIQGRTTVIYMIGWGITGLVLIKWLYPLVAKYLRKIPHKIYHVTTSILFVAIFLDVLITWTAVTRNEMKEKGIPAYTFIGKFYDEHFDEEYIMKKYPNMEEN